ncbi:E3 ubiquitin-protein ligase RAD18-like isoform X2 [Phymastichus coffea]|uniref:E3 ubiquitin-protein ligase RAD18-like isoform X2 n=1 Tax=Phymastichus coffea TaxID=108790 RepID=UPI00273B43B4|nr:E3 ubiquitin-protein ligase RAD18-like isoform X2 [Phymastichus coffea]
MSKIREITWPEEFIELKRIEQSMICGICYEYMETTVMTPCSHNYCSLCIRKYLHYKSQCPACFNVFFEKDLYINREMDVLIQHYIKVREKLISLIENRVVYNTIVQEQDNKEERSMTPPVRPFRSNQSPKSPKIQEIKENEPKMSCFSSTNNTLINNASSPKIRNSLNFLPSIAKIFNTPKRKETVAQPDSVVIKSVLCPVCSVDISENRVNVHLDACLEREVNQKAAKTKEKHKRQPLPKLVLRVMKDAELRKKMKEFGLPTNGDRKALESRFTRYSTIYNAECDKLEPRPVSDLIRQCEMEEKQERKLDHFLVSSTSTSTSNSIAAIRLQFAKNLREEKIEDVQKTYRLANKMSFDKLIEEVKHRRKLEEANKSDNDATVINSNSVSISEINKNENGSVAIESGSFNPSGEIPFNASDSDESCPLQHYKSDDPMPFLLSSMYNANPIASTSGNPIKLSHENLCHINSHMKPTNMTEDIYEASTDVSTDDEIQNSPVRNQKLNRKKVRLSLICPKQLSSAKSDNIESEINDSSEKSTRDASVRDLCNSNINFSFEEMSDESFSEFSNKQKSKVKVIETEQIKENSLKNIGRVSSRNRKAKAKKTNNRVALSDFSNNTTDDWHNDKMDDLSAKLVNTTTIDVENINEQKIGENTKTEKENNVLIDDEHCKSMNETAVCRPVRKRNRPSRYNQSQTSMQDCKIVAMPDGSLKRRRGRSNIKSTNLSMDESLKPPKRPVRRRQIVASHDS